MWEQPIKKELDHENDLKITQKPLCWTQILEKYTCVFCNYATYFKVFLKKHNHLKQEQNVETLKTYSCHRCGLQTHSLVLVTVHKKKCADNTQQPSVRRTIPIYRCKQCPYTTKILYTLRRHVERVHSTTFDATKWDKFELNINQSNKVYPQKLPKLHTKKKPFECDKCTYSTRSIRCLHKHVESKHTSAWCQCQQCPFQTKFEISLQSHLKAYHSEDAVWYKCELCEYKGRTHKQLYVHNRYAHQVKKWFKCDLCYFTTQWEYSLRRHMISKHTDEKNIEWFMCELCEYRTKFKEDWRRHMKIKHGWIAARGENFKQARRIQKVKPLKKIESGSRIGLMREPKLNKVMYKKL